MKRVYLCISLAGLLGGVAGAGIGAYQRQESTIADPSFERGDSKTGTAGELASKPRLELLGVATQILAGDIRLEDLDELGTALRGLGDAELAALLDHFERDSALVYDDRLSWAFSWWMKRSPDAATKWMEMRLDAASQDGPPGNSFAFGARGRTILAWAKADPQRAVEYAKAHPHAGLSKHLLDTAIRNWPEKDDRTRLMVLSQFPAGRAKNAAMINLLKGWAKQEPGDALAIAASLENPQTRAESTAGVLRAWSGKDAEAALRQYGTLALSDMKLYSDLLAGLVKSDPTSLPEWLGRLDATQLSLCGPKVIEKWAEHDPAAALSWAVTNGVGVGTQYVMDSEMVHDSLGRASWGSFGSISPLAKALSKDSVKTLAWISSLPPGRERERLTELAVAGTESGTKAAELFATLSPEAAVRTAGGVAGKFSTDLEQGQRWIESLPPGPARRNAWVGLAARLEKPLDLPLGEDRDAMLSGFAQSSASVNSATFGFEHAEQISNPTLRMDTLESMMESASEHDFYAKRAREWLDNSSMPQAWKRQWQETLSQKMIP